MSGYNFKRDHRISDESRKQLREFCRTLGGDPVKLADSLGLKVFETVLAQDEGGYLSYDPSKNSDSGFIIIIDKFQSNERKKFTIAHEIAHFVLHRNEREFQEGLRQWKPILPSHGTDNVIRLPLAKRSPAHLSASEAAFSTRKLGKRLENEADKFATQLLLPKYLVVRTIEYAEGRPVALAKRLGLSVAFVVRRFEEIYFEC